jgi:tetratricopeptide (TPR) repeat protein
MRAWVMIATWMLVYHWMEAVPASASQERAVVAARAPAVLPPELQAARESIERGDIYASQALAATRLSKNLNDPVGTAINGLIHRQRARKERQSHIHFTGAMRWQWDKMELMAAADRLHIAILADPNLADLSLELIEVEAHRGDGRAVVKIMSSWPPRLMDDRVDRVLDEAMESLVLASAIAEAQQMVDIWLKAFPESRGARRAAARIWQFSGMAAAGRRKVSKWLEKATKDEALRSRLADLCLLDGDLDAARRLLSRASDPYSRARQCLLATLENPARIQPALRELAGRTDGPSFACAQLAQAVLGKLDPRAAGVKEDLSGVIDSLALQRNGPATVLGLALKRRLDGWTVIEDLQKAEMLHQIQDWNQELDLLKRLAPVVLGSKQAGVVPGDYHYLLGRCYFHAGQFAAAEREYDRALSAGKDDGTLHLHKAKNYGAMKQPAAARREVELAFQAPVKASGEGAGEIPRRLSPR